MSENKAQLAVGEDSEGEDGAVEDQQNGDDNMPGLAPLPQGWLGFFDLTFCVCVCLSLTQDNFP
jgi:hypothetical protein